MKNKKTFIKLRTLGWAANRKPSSLILGPAANKGFTLIELILVIVILGVLAVSITINWPTGMDDDAARGELKRALRYAQHKAMTRGYTGPTSAWGFIVSGNRYTIQRQNGMDQAEAGYLNRNLLADAGITLTGPDIYFNGLGEPTDVAGVLLAASQTYIIKGGITVNVSPETGYVQ